MQVQKKHFRSWLRGGSTWLRGGSIEPVEPPLATGMETYQLQLITVKYEIHNFEI